MSDKYLIIILGPTAVGKTRVSIELAKSLHTEIINADSRQVFREMKIGTAIPIKSEQDEVKHHFLGTRSIFENYNASQFEQQVISFLNSWFTDHDVMVMVGGSGLYIDAVCKGIDDLPSIDPDIRKQIHLSYHEKGIDAIRLKLKRVDPDYFAKVDLNNPQRIMKALEIFEMTGRPYSDLLTGKPKERKFKAIKMGLDMPRNELHERINNRVDLMIEEGLILEAQSLLPYKNLNALNSVGYKELFDYFEGKYSLEEAITKIKSHTRQYARRQLTWFHKDKTITWFHPNDYKAILKHPEGVGVPLRGVL